MNELTKLDDRQATLFLDHINTLVFCGVPSYGLEEAVVNSLATMAEGQPNEQLVRSIGRGSELPSMIHKDFNHSFSKKKYPYSTVYSVYETAVTPTACRIVCSNYSLCLGDSPLMTTGW